MKYCKDCKFCRMKTEAHTYKDKTSISTTAMCRRVAISIYGTEQAIEDGSSHYCRGLRESEDFCGGSAKWFEPKESE